MVSTHQGTYLFLPVLYSTCTPPHDCGVGPIHNSLDSNPRHGAPFDAASLAYVKQQLGFANSPCFDDQSCNEAVLPADGSTDDAYDASDSRGNAEPELASPSILDKGQQGKRRR